MKTIAYFFVRICLASSALYLTTHCIPHADKEYLELPIGIFYQRSLNPDIKNSNKEQKHFVKLDRMFTKPREEVILKFSWSTFSKKKKVYFKSLTGEILKKKKIQKLNVSEPKLLFLHEPLIKNSNVQMAVVQIDIEVNNNRISFPLTLFANGQFSAFNYTNQTFGNLIKHQTVNPDI